MNDNSKPQKGFERMVTLFHNSYTAWIILAISLMLTLTASWLSYRYSTRAAEQRFGLRATEIAEAIQFRMLYYEQALWGGVGLQNASNEVSRVEFKEYVASLQIEKQLPGIQGIGYSIPVSKSDKATHVKRIQEEGFPDYSIRPKGERDAYSAIIFLEPFDWRNKRAFGYDMWSNDMRRKAMSRARDNGVAANSGIITLVQETTTDVQKGFLMYLPVYQKGLPIGTIEERREAFKGWVYSPFRAGDLMRGILSEEELEYELEVFDGDEITEAAMLFDSDSICHLNLPDHNPDFKKVVKLSLQGRNWNVYIHTKPNILSRQEALLPILIGVLGLTVDLILFLVIYSLYFMQKKTRKLAFELEIQKGELINANKELSQFAYIASHDLQEPLRTVSNYTQMLEEDYGDKLDEEGRGFIKTLQSSTTRMSQLIHAILEYSRIGRVKSVFEIVDCNQLVQEIEDDLNVLIQENNTTLIYTHLPSIKGDKEMLRQLFSNFITNAIKYRKKEVDPVVTIEASESASHFEFSITDNGIGIEKQYQSRIFEIFQRLHNKSLYAGTGIGLSSCKKITDLHHGTIDVDSQLNRGSIFRFTISKLL